MCFDKSSMRFLCVICALSKKKKKRDSIKFHGWMKFLGSDEVRALIFALDHFTSGV